MWWLLRVCHDCGQNLPSFHEGALVPLHSCPRLPRTAEPGQRSPAQLFDGADVDDPVMKVPHELRHVFVKELLIRVNGVTCRDTKHDISSKLLSSRERQAKEKQRASGEGSEGVNSDSQAARLSHFLLSMVVKVCYAFISGSQPV